MAEPLAEHRRALARELLTDIELPKLPAAGLVLRAARLAQDSGDAEAKKWLHFERFGYSNNDDLSLRYMDLTRRWILRDQKIGYWGSIGEIEGTLSAAEQELRQLRVPDVHATDNPPSWAQDRFAIAWPPPASAATSSVLKHIQTVRQSIAQLRSIQSQVLHLLHRFVSSQFYLLEFSSLAATLFDKHKARVDSVLKDLAGDALEKVAAIYDRLAAGDREAVSHALTTCRRIINAFADAVFPAREDPVRIGDVMLEVGPDKTLNRINAYVAERTTSESRRERLRKTLRPLHERVNAGVHAEVTLEEAMALFLQTYLILGEIALIREPPAEPRAAEE